MAPKMYMVFDYHLSNVQKFRFCGDGDCPDWVLAEINSTLSVLSAVKLKILTQTVCRSLLGETIPVRYLSTKYMCVFSSLTLLHWTGGQNTEDIRIRLVVVWRTNGRRRSAKVGVRVLALSAGKRNALRRRCGHIQRGAAAARPAPGAFGGDLSCTRRIPAGDYSAADRAESDR